MATQIESVVTPQRYEQGISYAEWMATIDRNEEKFKENYDDFTVHADDADAIKALMAKANGPAKVLALGEAWCPDVVRGIPAMARLCEATGLDFKIFFRDQNLDIMNEFLYKGEFQSIPTFVFYTKDHQYLGHWIEKAQKARDDAPLMRAISARIRDEAASEEQKAAATKEYADFQRGEVWDSWRHAQVSEVRSLLEKACK